MRHQDIEDLPRRANGDAWLTHRGRFLDTTFLLEMGEHQYLIRIRDGGVESVEPGPFTMPRWDFALRASEEDWRTFWAAGPQPGYHDLVAMLKFKRLALDGDPYPFMTHIRYFRDLLGRLRDGYYP